MQTEPTFYMHHNRGVPKLAFTIRQDRQIRLVHAKPFNKVVISRSCGTTFIVTKGLCQTVQRLGRLKLTPYTGNWPVFALIWTRFKEVIGYDD
ncbi:hypothetical protein [Pseudomonas aeruginosa]|uniref:hypothetical protein n=1 Tax=Pseudomonas aeruginosa TaxID=287 RepID=UPI003F838C05